MMNIIPEIYNHENTPRSFSSFVCEVCGNTVYGQAPDKCPVCGAPKGKFTKIQ